MPGMSEQVAESVVWLATQERFRNLLGHFRSLEAEIQEQINMTSTPKDEREILVHVNERLRNEVIRVVELAQDVLKRRDAITPARAGAR
jgi:hypothetical protein